MSASLAWFAIGFVLLVVELMTGTFYVLMIALALAVGGVVALLGAGRSWQFVAAALFGAIATLVLRRTHFGRLKRSGDVGSDPRQNLDIGQRVEVHAWKDGVARVHYRGSQWDATLVPGETETSGAYYIREVRGTRLVVSSRAP